MQSNKSIFIIIFFQFWSSLALDTTILHTGNKIENGERRLVILIASYNNSEWYKNNLDSIFEQFYSNYRIIYIDDASNDGTPDLVEDYIKERGMTDKVLLIRNTERQYKMANIYRAFHLCDDRDIIIELDGDDWLSTAYAFNVYNEVYSNPHVWLTYGHFMEWPTMKPQRIREMPQAIFKLNKMRDVTANFWAGLRTYYAWLVKQIKIEDLLFQGTFFQRSSDAAIMYPLLEMAHSHAKFVGDMLLLHNVQTPLNDHKADRKMQDDTFGSVKKKKGYSHIKEPIIPTYKQDHMPIDLYIYAHDAQHLIVLLQSLDKLNNVGHIKVYGIEPNSDIKNAYPQVVFSKKTVDISLENSMLSDLLDSRSEYVIVLNDRMKIIKPINLNECLIRLETTKAWAFLLNIQKSDLQKPILIEEGICGMQLNYNQEITQENDNIFGVLIKSSHLKELFNTLEINNKKDFGSMSKHFCSKILPQVFLLFEQGRIITQK
jgi:glycosyltransferase involved in cell wall biosynthesis